MGNGTSIGRVRGLGSSQHGAGHWLQVEKPRDTSAQMLRFLAAVEPR